MWHRYISFINFSSTIFRNHGDPKLSFQYIVDENLMKEITMPHLELSVHMLIKK